MLNWEAKMNIRDLHKQGHSMRAIARITGHARTTVSRVLHPKQQKPPQKRGRKSRIEPFQDYLRERYLTTGLSGVRLFDEIRQMGYAGAVDAVYRFLRSVDQPRQALTKATVRFETAPGEQAQVDWAECGYYINESGERRKVYAFVMILGFSRMLYVEFTTRMNIETLINCHKRAFEYFGGSPRQILYDNMKQVRLSPAQWNPLMQDFLQHYGIVPKTCRPYRPRTKGKVERAIRYLKDNFLKERDFADLADLKAKGQYWQNETANVRVHATTGKRPVDLLDREGLTPTGAVVEYKVTTRRNRTVDSEGFVSWRGSRYSVPPAVVGQQVIVEQGEQRVLVRLGEVIVAEHKAAARSGESIVKAEHVAEMWHLAMARTQAPPVSKGQILFEQTVEARPLSVYEEVATR